MPPHKLSARRVLSTIVTVGFFLGLASLSGSIAHAHGEGEASEPIRAEVVRVLADTLEGLPGLSLQTRVQELEVRLLNGPEEGGLVVLVNDLVPLSVGDKLFVTSFVASDNTLAYGILEPDRRGALLLFAILFAAIVVFFGGKQGLRALLALAGSFFIIFYLLFPALLAGYPPVLVSTLVAVAIITFAILVTHGWNKTSLAALLGTITTILLAIIFAELAVSATNLSGFADEAAMYVNLDSGGLLNFRGLLLGAIIIGILGVLDDVAITQAAAVEQLRKAAPHLSRKELYRKALVIGREHVGALVNTLALAYAGAALPLLLYLASGAEPFALAINREVFAAEIIRTIVGSTAIIFAVPITTWLAVRLLETKGVQLL
ncbi:MAG: hypothetical protein COV10_04060 [Candidatus Vogelbacteria bacterium CG10_big_fil_rev_8_21_14_0_10_51_16]|uniref:YibE/F family protein n=1 Tax=Candidatus Vogelbacteria bacterium CG10_big_fil_rev_8_21_14_0_10_51_16 TaxID=1975045 RepID=A0A2H0RDU9_9BACT|nr:MAG: hypothetical protein COV10_04060 [Candidatus Vogelbacteria bacterium CG10_big_fil_rev_8_21_14_0_10_51_16]